MSNIEYFNFTIKPSWMGHNNIELECTVRTDLESEHHWKEVVELSAFESMYEPLMEKLRVRLKEHMKDHKWLRENLK